MTKYLLVALATLAALMALALGLLAWPGSAQAEGNLSFSIIPAKAYDGQLGPSGYFSHSLAPGAVVTDEALVMNKGDVPVSLRLYAADAATAINGGTSFANAGEQRNGVAHWLSLSVAGILLGPGEQRVVPFTISVPSSASPGQHVGGLVVEALPDSAEPSGPSGAGFVVNVVRRVGVAVLIDVPGPHAAGLEITGVCLRQQDDDLGATFEIAVRNTGNVFVRGEGSLVIGDRQGAKLASIPIEMDTVLPGDSTHFQVTHPVRLTDGGYRLSAALRYAGGETAALEGADLVVKDGQPEAGCQPKDESRAPEPGLAPAVITLTPGVATLTPTEEQGGLSIGQYAAYGVGSAAFLLAIAALLLLRRMRARRLRHP